MSLSRTNTQQYYIVLLYIEYSKIGFCNFNFVSLWIDFWIILWCSKLVFFGSDCLLWYLYLFLKYIIVIFKNHPMFHNVSTQNPILLYFEQYIRITFISGKDTFLCVFHIYVICMFKLRLYSNETIIILIQFSNN